MFSYKFRSSCAAVLIIVLSICSTTRVLQIESKIRNENILDKNEQVILGSYDYHNVTVYVQKGQAISGDWEAKPADVLSPPFLVFIVDSTNFDSWVKSDNLTQAANRIPGESLLYIYDPLLKVDDIPLDGRRSGTIQVKVPYTDSWTLVMYSGATLIPLTFTWHLDVFEGIWQDIVLWGTVGISTLGILIGIISFYVRRKRGPEDEVDQLLRYRDEIREEQPTEGALGSLEEVGEEPQEFDV